MNFILAMHLKLFGEGFVSSVVFEKCDPVKDNR